MNYNIEDIEDQIISTLKAEPTLSSCNIETHVGVVDPRLFLDPAYREEWKGRLPFIFIHYHGSEGIEEDEIGSVTKDRIKFRMFIGAQNLRSRQESQRSAYAILRSVYDSIHGKVPNASATSGSPLVKLGGDQIVLSTFNGYSPLLRVLGINELLIVNMQGMVIYQSDYSIDLQA